MGIICYLLDNKLLEMLDHLVEVSCVIMLLPNPHMLAVVIVFIDPLRVLGHSSVRVIPNIEVMHSLSRGLINKGFVDVGRLVEELVDIAALFD